MPKDSHTFVGWYGFRYDDKATDETWADGIKAEITKADTVMEQIKAKMTPMRSFAKQNDAKAGKAGKAGKTDEQAREIYFQVVYRYLS